MVEKNTYEIDERAHYEATVDLIAISRGSRVYVTANSYSDTEMENLKPVVPLIIMYLLRDTLRKKQR